MRGLAGFLVLAFLASCASPTTFPGPPPLPTSTADRGIGGTGGPSGAVEVDRGIGGTGIVGVITGFGSIFVDGLEVHYGASTPVTVDDASASPTALRTGQVVAVEAVGPLSALSAQSVSILHQVAGPVEAVEDNGRMARIAGQNVAIPNSIAGAAALTPGAWVAVSGLPRPDGSVVATRIDPSPAGLVRVRGQIVAGSGGLLRIGQLSFVPTPVSHVTLGQYATVTGHLLGDQLVARSLNPNLVAGDPFVRFGPRVGRVFIESYVTPADGRLRMARGLSVGVPIGMRTSSVAPGWAVLQLVRGSAGSPHAVGANFIAGPGTTPPPLGRVMHPTPDPEERPAGARLPVLRDAPRDVPNAEAYPPACEAQGGCGVGIGLPSGSFPGGGLPGGFGIRPNGGPGGGPPR